MTRCVVLMLVLVSMAAVAMGLEVTVTHGHRLVSEGWDPPPVDFYEGSVLTTLQGDAPMDTVGRVPGLVRLDDRTWQYRFPWDETEPRPFVFRDGSGAQLQITTIPEWPAYDPADHTLPTVMIDTEADSLWSPDLGIYCFGDGENPNWDQRGDMWERDAAFRWYDSNGTLVHQRTVGLRINGNWTRTLQQKSLRLYFDHHGEVEEIVDDFFGPDPESHRRLILRQGSRWPFQFIHDPLACEITSALGHPCCRWSPVAAYINGEPWGIYHLRERPDQHWAEEQLGLSGDYDLVKDYGGEEPADFDAWVLSLEQVIQASERQDHQFFLDLSREFDLESYLDWVLIQAWSASADNGGEANKVAYRNQGGPWHLMCYDQDAMFKNWNQDHDFFQFFTSTTEAEWNANRPPEFYQTWWSCFRLFRFFDACLDNASFRAAMRLRWQHLTSTVLTMSWLDATLDEIVAAQASAESFHDERWDFSGTFESIAGTLRGYLAQRTPIADGHFWSLMEQRMDPVELERLTAAGNAEGQVTLAWQTYREVGNDGWRLQRRDGAASPWQQVTAIPAAGAADQGATYTHVDTAPAGTDVDYRLCYVAAGSTVTIPWIEPVDWPDGPPARVVINEFMASNDSVIQDETGDFEDWVELYNPGDETIDLGGYFLSDDSDTPTRWALPAGTMLLPQEFLLVWCDDDVEDGPLHTNFKLSAGGESIGVYAMQDEAVVVVDEITFGAQITDVSRGRAPDGSDIWQAFSPASPGGPNVGVAVDLSGPRALTVDAHPNPFNPRCTVVYSLPASGPVQVRVFDVGGRLVRDLVGGEQDAGVHRVIWDGCDAAGARVASGIYQVVVQAANQAQSRKLTLLK